MWALYFFLGIIATVFVYNIILINSDTYIAENRQLKAKLEENAKIADKLTVLIRSRSKVFKKEEKVKIEVARDILNQILAAKLMKNSEEVKT